MSGFGGFGSGGFGQQQQQQQQSTGFGGFGSTTTPATGFGQTGTTGFGSAPTTGGGLFGGGGTTGGFGSSGGFGSTSGGAFGAAKPGGFGTTATTGGGLFGSNTATASGSTGGFGGFGATPAATSSPFGGGGTASGGLFGAKPAFGASATTTSNPFGGAASTSSPFGGGAFGAPAATALGGTVGECQGTGSVAFQAFVEKEPNSATNQQNSFQSISFQQPYQKFSPEELRLADYAQGRRYGNANGQAGAFGTSNFGGGFGSTTTASTGFGSTATTGGGLFGGGATSSPFGATQQPAQTSAFGSTGTAGGLFGSAPKPATGGLFGSTAAPSTGGGLFGNSSTGFGASTTGTTTGGFGQTSAAGGSSLFGTSGAAAPKPFSFGTTQPAATSSTPFGQGTSGTSAFGGGGGGLFGSTPQQQSTTGFGQQPAAASNPFGGFGGATQQTGSSLFGSTQNKPAAGGLFGAPATGSSGGLFGSTPQASTNTNPFGGSATAPAAGGLFGAKPATGGLFGSTSQAQGTTGGLFGGGSFGNSQTQNQGQQSTGGLFGNTQQKPTGGLFGAPAQQQGTSSLFGAANTQPQNSLFGGNSQQQQQPQNSLFGGNSSMYGASQSQSLTTSINDNGAYGSASLFGDLNSTNLNNPGPVATPISSINNRPKRAAAIPIARLSTTSSPRFSTPQRKGFGFSYSTYASPSSVSSTSSTPGTFSSSTLGSGLSSFSRALTKSVSTSGLRNSYSASESILAPGAFSASPNIRAFGSTGSVKKLNINRSLRSDLFSPPTAQNSRASTNSTGSILKKRVSFEANGVNGSENGVEQSRASADPSPEELGLLRPRPQTNAAEKTTSNSAPEMTQVKGNELAIVPEESASSAGPPPLSAQKDKVPQEYWMSPSRNDIEAMTQAERKKVVDFTVGRIGVGKVKFNPPVDLSTISLDDIIGKLVQLETRNCTVYPDKTTKPKVGSGLNVPATISLENSWPRALRNKGQMKLQKHVSGLKKVPDTAFIDYNQATGVWTFTVEHFTTYAFPSDDEFDGDNASEFGQSTLSLPPDTPTPNVSTPMQDHHEQSFASTSQYSRTESDPDDTFQFRKKKVLPGAFDEDDLYEEEENEGGYLEKSEHSFLDNRSVGSQSEDGAETMDQDAISDDESVSVVDQDMAGSYPHASNTAELDEDSQNDDDAAATPGALMRARARVAKMSDTPSKQFSADNDWTAALWKTASPKKQDRALLKSLVDVGANTPKTDIHAPVIRRLATDAGGGFANSIDLMNSLFGVSRSPNKKTNVPVKRKGFEWPYAKRAKTAEGDEMSAADRKFHDQSMKPSWGPDGTLIYSASPDAKTFGRSSRRAHEREGILAVQQHSIVSARRDVVQAKFQNEASAKLLSKHKKLTVIDNSGFVPFAMLDDQVTLSDFIDESVARGVSTHHEKLIWQLASILFDDIRMPRDLGDDPGVLERVRKDNLSIFWQSLVADASSNKVALARSPEEKAIGLLSAHKVADACAQLIKGKDYHLANLVARIGIKESSKRDVKEQLRDWKKTHVLAEFSQPIRAIYELLAGNCCICEGEKGPVEDRIESFVISDRFELDWRRSFGLRLWYGIFKQDSIASAVELFMRDLESEKETAYPAAWYIEQNIPPLWSDAARSEREDLLWGLLKLFAYKDTDLNTLLSPENCSLSPVDFRLSWQLAQVLSTIESVAFKDKYSELADRLTISFAAQLTSEGSWLDATFVLLHLLSEDARSQSLQDHLAHHARYIGTETSEVFKKLVDVYMIPDQWVWEAKALYQRSVVKSPRGEVECLLKAGSFDEAHRTFAREVAPKTVIEMDYDGLRNLLAGFQGQEASITEWHLGGEIYQDFLNLLESQKRGRSIEDATLNRLLIGLPAIVLDARHPSFMETVAAETISDVVAKAVILLSKNAKKSHANKVLQLPLTEDMYLKHTVDLSLQYYRALVAGGK